MDIKDIVAILNKKDVKLVVLLCHQNADPDAVCSAYAFSQLLKKIKPSLEVNIALTQGANKLSKKILNAIPIKVVAFSRIDYSDVIFLLDTSTIEQLDKLKPQLESLKKPIIVIDHHTLHPKIKGVAQLTIIREEASSTCEIVYDMFKQVKIIPSIRASKALFLGIAFDTKRFLKANSNTLKKVAELIEHGLNAKELLNLLTSPMAFSERTSRIKAAQRLKLEKISEWLIVFSHVSSYQSSAAHALLNLGAHVAIVYGTKKRESRISMRSSDIFYQKTGIHLGKDIAIPLGEHNNGVGGGHSTAAGVNVKGDLNQIPRKCLKSSLKKN